MNSSASAFEAGRMLADLSWTRGLAASLVGSRGAEDVAQEAWLAALGRRGEAWPPSRQWLAGTVRNLSARWWRSAKRREEREAIASRSERLPSTEALVARSEEQQRVARLTLALEEPYRTIVLLRFQEGLDATEIARRQGLPADTVRWRLRKGLRLLRAQLEREEGRDWRLALLPCAKSFHPLDATGVGTAAPLTIGGLLLGTKFFFAIAASVLALSAVLWMRDRATPSATLTSAPQRASGNVALIDSQEIENSAPGPVASLLQEETTQRVAMEVLEEQAETEGYTFTGRAIDENDQPLVGLGVGFRWSDELPKATTDEQGNYMLTLREVTTLPLTLVVGDDPFREKHQILLQREAKEDRYRAFKRGLNSMGTVVLGPAGAVRGQVRSEDGNPVSKPWVIMRGTASGAEWGDESGHFQIGHLKPGTHSLQAQQYGIQPTRANFEVVVSEATLIEIIAAPSPTISGIILSENGLPLENVKVAAGKGYFFDWGTLTKADGNFVLSLAQEGPSEMEVSLKGWDTVDMPLEPVLSGAIGLVIHMAQLPELHVRVVDAATEEPLQQYELTVLPHGGSEGSDARQELRWGTIPSRHQIKAPDGVALTQARPGIDAIKIHATGHFDEELSVAYDPGAPGTMTIRLSSGRTISGRITWRGEPLGDATVRLVRGSNLIVPDPLTYLGETIEPNLKARAERIESHGVSVLSNIPVAALYPPAPDSIYKGSWSELQAKTRSADDGSFLFKNVNNRRGMTLCVSPPEEPKGAGLFLSAPLDLASSSQLNLGVIEMPASAHMKGRVSLREPGQLSGLEVSLWAGEWLRTTTDDWGTFELEGMPTGEHILFLRPSPFLVAQTACFAVRTSSDMSTEVELELDNRASSEVALTLLVNGQPLKGQVVLAPPVTGNKGRSKRFRGETDEQGLIHGLFAQGLPRLVKIQTQSTTIVIPHGRISLPFGHSAQTIELRSGALSLERSSAAWPSRGHMILNLKSKSDPSAWAFCRLEAFPEGFFNDDGQLVSDENGAVLFPALPAGPASIEIACHGESGLLWSETRDITIEAEGLVSLEL